MLLASLLIWLVIGSRGKWIIKLAMMFLTVAVSFEIWRSLASYLGHSKPTSIEEMHGNKRFSDRDIFTYKSEGENATLAAGVIFTSGADGKAATVSSPI
jgi:hypothetical protein